MGMSHASMVFTGGAIYLFIRFFVWDMFKNYTKHRGMWHSLPAAMIASTVAFLLCSNPDITIRLYQAWAVLLGFLSHLFLDEFYSIDINGRRLKKSFGTAVKFWSGNSWANYSTYFKLLVVGLLAINDPMLQQSIDSEDSRIPRFARVTLQSLQFKALKSWVPHDHATHQEFNQRTLLPIRGGLYQTRRPPTAPTEEPGMFVQWINYLTGKTRARAAPEVDAAGASNPGEQQAQQLDTRPSQWR
jgi:hypothetical protein